MDSELKQLIDKESRRQRETIDLIASENYCSGAVLEALGSVFVNKYAEGYPRARYYRGNSVVDEVEELAQRRALEVFGLEAREWGVNVQPYSGSPANLAVYLALVPPGEKVMGMRLDMGGHLTHGHKVSATGKIWRQVPYGVSKKTEVLDYDELMELAKRERPKLIIAGYTAYPRVVNFKRFREIADEVGAYLMADVSHLAGLIAGEAYPSPFPHADVVTTTTHKTLRGPRSAAIFSKKSPCKFQITNSKLQTNSNTKKIKIQTIDKAIDKAVFPGLQGGPHINQIAAVAAALEEAKGPDFKVYASQIVKNARILAEELTHRGWRVVSGGTDSHLLLLDTWVKKVGGEEASVKLEEAGIVTNKNTIPYDERSPMDPSGLRLGTPAVTTRGMREGEMKQIAGWINLTLSGTKPVEQIKGEVVEMCREFPIYKSDRKFNLR